MCFGFHSVPNMNVVHYIFDKLSRDNNTEFKALQSYYLFDKSQQPFGVSVHYIDCSKEAVDMKKKIDLSKLKNLNILAGKSRSVLHTEIRFSYYKEIEREMKLKNILDAS